MQSVRCYILLVYKIGGVIMKWETLKKNIKKECRANNKNEQYIRAFLSYAKKLNTRNLPIISSPEHFSELVGLEHQYVCNMAYGGNHFYRHFYIQKNNGKLRKIYEPLPDLKLVQTWILENILEKCTVSEYAKAFVKKRTLKHNARFHRAQNVVVTMDIKDFFPSIKIKSIVSIFQEMGYYENLSFFLAHLCCLNNKLPQGAPTSPYLSNLRLLQFDNTVSQYTKEKSIRYTRYADDLTFSGDFNPHHLIKDISRLVFNEGFTINSQKTRVAYQNARQEVTGIVVNSHMQLAKNKRKDIRQEVYYIKKFGLESHLDHINETRAHYLNHLLGKINFALFINPNDSEMNSYYESIKALKQIYSEHNE